MKKLIFVFGIVISFHCQNFAQTTTVTVPGLNDVMIVDRYPTAGYNSYLTNLVGFYNNQYTCGSLITFDLSVIPANATITSANMGLFFADNNAGSGFVLHAFPTGTTTSQIFLKRINQQWSPSTVTWNTRPTATDTNAVELTKPTATNQNYPSINVTALTNDMLKKGNNGYFLQMVRNSPVSNASYYLTLGSFDNTVAAYRPTLVVSYTSSAVTSVDESSSFAGVVRVFPNPTKESFKIEGITEPVQVTFVSALGQELATVAAKPSQFTALPSLPQGQYVLRITSAGKNSIQRLTIE